MKRSTRMVLAEETVRIAQRGSYQRGDGIVVDVAPAVAACLAATRSFTPEQVDAIRREVLARPTTGTTEIEVRNETTLAGITRLLAGGAGPVAALNFASAKNPGGGFLGGSQAQEESLARSSALYASLLRCSEFYQRHRGSSSCLYSDAMILSPDCPIFRNDDGELLDQPLLATFVTSPAPNAGAIANNTPQDVPLIPETLRRRAECVLALAAWHGHPTLILGAWGCGVFRNDPHVVAQAFAGHLRSDAWTGRFARVVFSVLDTSASQETFEAFRLAFGR